MPQVPLVGTYTYACMSILSHTTIILLPSCFPPSQLKILYETVGHETNVYVASSITCRETIHAGVGFESGIRIRGMLRRLVFLTT